MDRIPCTQRFFPLKLAEWLPIRYAAYLRWLSHLLERLGPAPARALWEEACRDNDDPLLSRILSEGWTPMLEGEAVDGEESIDRACAPFFRSRVEGMTRAEARGLVERMPPLPQIRRRFPSLNVQKRVTAYEALHLAFDGQARLVEALVGHHGVEGQLIAYDALREARIAAAGGKTGTVEEFVAGFVSPPVEGSIFAAGLEKRTVRAAGREAVVHVVECEWARYFRERHPSVGYLMACSTDEVAYRAFNGDLRMQRPSTLMEGGARCDFRIYAVGEPGHGPT